MPLKNAVERTTVELTAKLEFQEMQAGIEVRRHPRVDPPDQTAARGKQVKWISHALQLCVLEGHEKTGDWNYNLVGPPSALFIRLPLILTF